ncbi:MAG: elongation factor Ts [Gammaproteobacteria bacterium]|nr:elongation factor Ts [Gammaproteobacteria bacterium]
MVITASMVKELRERTGLGMMDCKAALSDADGDMELAIEELRKKSALKAAKKSGRTTANGLIGIKVADDGSKGVMVEVNIETDFAAKNKKFIAFVEKIATAAFQQDLTDPKDLLVGELEEERKALVQEIGENMNVRRIACLGSKDSYVATYIHTDNRKAVLLELSGKHEELGKDLAMHVTAINPLVVETSDVSTQLLAKEREIYTAQAEESGKPPEIVEKMVEGRVRKYLAEVSFVEQPFVKDGNIKVGQMLSEKNIACKGFVRFEVGEGIEVVEEDFASEVAAQIKDLG